MPQQIKLNQTEIKEKILNNFGGFRGYGWAYWLTVAPDGSQYCIRSADGSRQWFPWSEDWAVERIPAPFGDGSSEMNELAEDMLREQGILDKARDRAEEEDVSLIEIAEETDGENWQAYIDNSLDWYAEEFLLYLNGEDNNLPSYENWGEPLIDGIEFTY